jgi:hypothetical protein
VVDDKRKRDVKEEIKQIAKVAKEHSRSNRDGEMDFFAVYYKEKFAGMKFIQVKKVKHP